ncbi:MAG TPA: glycosyltransferase family 1 protein [Gaiellales bacterium]|jgi:glycosyltransferase involved in cell wall biosynthesis|nr:glycosyltransferase family 1 protein [Gaiellales bacterium]
MILIDASPLQSEHRLRGVGAYVRELIANLEREPMAATRRPHYFATRRPAVPLLPPERTHRVPRNHMPAQGYWLTNELVLRGALRRLRADVFYATDFNGLLLNPHGRTVAALYDLTALHEGLGDPLSAARWRTYYRRLRRCDLLLAISEHTRSDAIAALDLDPRSIAAIPLGIDTERFVPGRGAGAFAHRKPYFLHIGGRNPNKNQATLLEAFARAQRELPDRELLLAGPWGAADLAWLETERARLGLTAVHHIGYAESESLPSLYGNAEAFVFPSLAEGFGFPVLEAMATGTPVITSNCSSLPEVAGDAAVLVDPRDAGALAAAMIDVVRRPEPARVQRGIERARRFTWAETARRTWQHLCALAEDGPAGAG